MDQIKMVKILILEDDKNRIDVFKKNLDGIEDIYITDYANQAISWLESIEFDYIFLDHDLGGLQMEWDEENCGMTVAKYLNKHPQRKANVIIHSLNTHRAKEMEHLIEGSQHIPFVWNLIKLDRN